MYLLIDKVFYFFNIMKNYKMKNDQIDYPTIGEEVIRLLNFKKF